MTASISHQATFFEQIKRMLSYWIEQTTQLDLSTFQLLEQERANLFHALNISFKANRFHSETSTLLIQSTPFVNQRGYWQEWIPLLEVSIEEQLFQHHLQHLNLLIGLGQSYRLDSQLEKAITIHLEAEKIADRIPDRRYFAQVQHELLEDYRLARQYESAKEAGQKALSLLAGFDDNRELIANCYKMLGDVYQRENSFDQSEIYFAKAVALYRELNKPIKTAQALNDFAILHMALNQLDMAEQYLNEAQTLLAPTLNEFDKCMVWLNIGVIHSSRQQWTEAEAAFHQANSQFLRQSPDIPRKARIQNNLGYVLFRNGEHKRAEVHLIQALNYWESISDELEHANTLSTLADNKLAMGDKDAALALYTDLLQQLESKLDDPLAKKLYLEYEKVRAELINEKG